MVDVGVIEIHLKTTGRVAPRSLPHAARSHAGRRSAV